MSLRSSLLLLSVVLASLFSFAGAPQRNELAYYGDRFYSELRSGLANEDLKLRIKSILRGQHMVTPGTYDQIVQNCTGQKGCYAHTNVGYFNARMFLMAKYYLINRGGQYGVREVYCNRDYLASEFRSQKPGPSNIPDDRVVNVEHTWPQSRFTGKYAADEQKADLHHLFPSDSQVNGLRGNKKFGEVVQDTQVVKCPVSRYGKAARGQDEVFEPPQEHKGKVARSLFYFSVRYDLPISPEEETTLRKWNREFPVDEDEANRNNEIYKVQGSRNPFVDYPDLAEKISDF